MDGRISIRDTIVTGFALFAMFFGAGNLIFPPTLGQESGSQWVPAFLGFLLADAVLACVGVYAVNKGGAPVRSIGRAVGRVPGAVLNTAAILCLCVLFAMPRTAATSFEVSVAPFAGDDPLLLLVFSLAFFGVVFLLAVRESRVVDIIGRFFTPTLLLGMLVLVAAGIVHPLGEMAPPAIDHVFQEGVRAGYQTMDVLGVVAFSIVLLDSKTLKGITSQRGRSRALLRASVIATVLLGVVYGGLTYLGATSASLGTGLTQVQLLVAVTESLLGDFGLAVLAVVVLVACITTAVALVSSAAAYFYGLLGKRVRYGVLLALDCLIGVVICNVGLQGIIALADPVLGVVYPPLLTVVCMLLFQRRIRSRRTYQGAALGACVAGLVLELPVDALAQLSLALPFGSWGFGWLAFAVLGGVIGWLLGRGGQAPVERGPAS